jgi:hypothetical protein
MKTLISEVRRFQKIAGILKEEMSKPEQSQGMEEAAPKSQTRSDIAQKISDIAHSQGFTKIKTPKSDEDTKNLLRFKRKNDENPDGDDFVELYYFIDEPNKLRIQFISGANSENELAKKCLNSNKWEEIFGELSEPSYDDEDYDY